MFVCFSSLLTISLSFHLLVVFSVPNNPILDTRISCSVLLLSHAQGNPPGFCNRLYWRTLVELRPPPLARKRIAFFFFNKKTLFWDFLRFFPGFCIFDDFWQFTDLKGHYGFLHFFCIFFVGFFWNFLDFFIFYFFFF